MCCKPVKLKKAWPHGLAVNKLKFYRDKAIKEKTHGH